MINKSLTIIALALCLCLAVPVSALWNNGNWVAEDHNQNCDAVKFDPKTGVMSCYRDNNPVNEIKASNEGNGGIAVGSIRAGYSTLSNTIYVRNVLQDANSSSMEIKVNPDATFRIPEPDNGVLAPGNYTAKLDNFDLPDETVYFTIAANQQGPTYIAFIGQAASQPAASVCQRSILKASYCGVTIPAVTHDEYRYWISSHEHQCVVGIGEGCGPWQKEISVDTSHWSAWQTEEPDHCVYMTAKTSGYPNFKLCEQRTVTDTPAIIGGCADVTSNVREALSKGYTKFLFDNAHNPGGIFDITTTTLLSEIDDPAPGIVKDVSITYNDCSGNERHVSAEEYQVITLN